MRRFFLGLAFLICALATPNSVEIEDDLVLGAAFKDLFIAADHVPEILDYISTFDKTRSRSLWILDFFQAKLAKSVSHFRPQDGRQPHST